MKRKVLIIFSISIAVLFQMIQAINPYHVLELNEGATQEEIRKKYKAFKKAAKGNDVKIKLYDDAYQQIMLDSTLRMTIPKQQRVSKKPINQVRRNRRRRRGMPRLSDMFRRDYFNPPNPAKQASKIDKRLFQEDNKNYQQQIQSQYGYSLPPQIDDPSYHKQKKSVQQTMKDQNIAFNVKAASTILFIGSILLKLLPCFCIFMICRKWKPNGKNQNEQENNNPFIKAANGWSGKNRRTNIKKSK